MTIDRETRTPVGGRAAKERRMVPPAEPRSYYGQNQKLIDMSGREYQVSSDADLNMNSYGLVDNINPGNAIEVKVPFDVPPDTQMSMLELHDSMFSAGVRVAAAPGP